MKQWIPEICYEEDSNGLTSHIPFVQVPPGELMPAILFVFESQDTGECEPGDDGNPLPIFDMELHQYADMAILKKKLSLVDFDKVRLALDLEPLSVAQSKGKEISEKVKQNLH